MADGWSFGSLNLAGVDPEQGRKSLPPGSYTCRITKSEIRDTKDGRGKGLVVELTDSNGTGAVEDWINVYNKNEQAMEIGQKRLKALLVSAGHPNPDRPGDVKSMLGLHVGVHVEQGEDWTDKEGNKRKGGGKPRSSGAYFKPEGAPAPNYAERAKGPLPRDEIPF
jgi:hypothetical protein